MKTIGFALLFALIFMVVILQSASIDFQAQQALLETNDQTCRDVIYKAHDATIRKFLGF